MTFSYSDFVTQFLGLKLPAKFSVVASSLGFALPNISMRQVMSKGAPYAPDDSTYPFVDNSNNQPSAPSVAFFWMDEANYPPWIVDSDNWSGPPPNQLRQATSWELTLSPVNGSAPVLDATVPFANETAGLVNFEFNGQLKGNFTYQITAFNNYGSASTKGTAAITLAGSGPTIMVSPLMPLSSNKFEVDGTGFTNGNPVKISVSSSISDNSTSVSTNADNNGKFKTQVPCQPVCSIAGGGQLQFIATDSATNKQSNIVIKTCSS